MTSCYCPKLVGKAHFLPAMLGSKIFAIKVALTKTDLNTK